MSDVLHDILSRIHGLLSIASPTDLRRASEFPGISRPMRAALRELARERLRTWSPDDSRRQATLDFDRQEEGHKPPSAYRYPVGTDASEEQIYQIIRHCRAFHDKQAIVRFADLVGVAPGILAKDSRDRAARKLATSIAGAPYSLKRRALAALLDTDDRQTEGWFGLIKDSE
jgi:hypothetical protein